MKLSFLEVSTKRVINTAVSDRSGTIPCSAAGNIGHWETVGFSVRRGFGREEKIHCGLCHLTQRLDDGRTDITSGGEIDDPVIADDLDIVRNPDPILFQIGTDPPRQSVSIAEDVAP